MGTHPIFESDFDCLTEKMKILGPKCSGCCFCVAVWGVIMFILMGVFFQIKAPALRDDISPVSDSKEDVYAAYESSAYNCYITAGIYAAVVAFSGWQVMVNQKMSEYEN